MFLSDARTRAWIAGPIVSSPLATGTLKRVELRAVHCAHLTPNRLPAHLTPHRLDAIRERYSSYRCSKLSSSNYLGAGSLVGRERPAWKLGHLGNTLMLLMKRPTAQ